MPSVFASSPLTPQSSPEKDISPFIYLDMPHSLYQKKLDLSLSTFCGGLNFTWSTDKPILSAAPPRSWGQSTWNLYEVIFWVGLRVETRVSPPPAVYLSRKCIIPCTRHVRALVFLATIFQAKWKKRLQWWDRFLWNLKCSKLRVINKPIAPFQDLGDIDPGLLEGLHKLEDYAGGDEEDVFGVDFTVRRSACGSCYSGG